MTLFNRYFAAAVVFSVSASGQANVQTRPLGTASQAQLRATEDDSDSVDGPRLADAAGRLRGTFPGARTIREQRITPVQSGGSSLMGLIQRLLGEQVSRQHEGMKTRRFIYQAYNGKELVGLAHASAFELDDRTVQVILYFDPSATIRKIELTGIPEAQRQALDRGGFLDQFVGRQPEDFEVTLGRRGRIKSRGPFFSQAKRPAESHLRSTFEKITRSVRYNTAFMEVAYFIVQHPETDDTAGDQARN